MKQAVFFTAPQFFISARESVQITRKFPVTEEVTTINRIIFLRLESLILKKTK